MYTIRARAQAFHTLNVCFNIVGTLGHGGPRGGRLLFVSNNPTKRGRRSSQDHNSDTEANKKPTHLDSTSSAVQEKIGSSGTTTIVEPLVETANNRAVFKREGEYTDSHHLVDPPGLVSSLSPNASTLSPGSTRKKHPHRSHSHHRRNKTDLIRSLQHRNSLVRRHRHHLHTGGHKSHSNSPRRLPSRLQVLRSAKSCHNSPRIGARTFSLPIPRSQLASTANTTSIKVHPLFDAPPSTTTTTVAAAAAVGTEQNQQRPKLGSKIISFSPESKKALPIPNRLLMLRRYSSGDKGGVRAESSVADEAPLPRRHTSDIEKDVGFVSPAASHAMKALEGLSLASENSPLSPKQKSRTRKLIRNQLNYSPLMSSLAPATGPEFFNLDKDSFQINATTTSSINVGGNKSRAQSVFVPSQAARKNPSIGYTSSSRASASLSPLSLQKHTTQPLTLSDFANARSSRSGSVDQALTEAIDARKSNFQLTPSGLHGIDGDVNSPVHQHHDANYKLAQTKLAKLSLCSLGTHELRKFLLSSVQRATRAQLIAMTMRFKMAGPGLPEEPWLTYLGAKFWCKTFAYLDIESILTGIILVCSTFNELVTTEHCLQKVAMTELENVVGDDNMMKMAPWLVNVDRLSLQYCSNLSEISFKHVSLHCKKLRVLDVAYTRIDDVGLKFIAASCHDLEQLSLISCTEFSGSGLTRLGHLQHLEKLEMDNCVQLTDDCFKGFHSPSLKILTLLLCSEMTDFGLRYIADHCPSLETIRLEMCDEISDLGLQYLGHGCPELKTLGLERSAVSHITDRGIWHLAVNCPQLEYIDLCGVHQLTDCAMKSLSKNCSNLKHLFLHECLGISDTGVKLLVKQCKDLESLCFRKMHAISDDAVKAIAYCSSKLRYLDLGGCHKISNSGLRSFIKAKHSQLSEVYLSDCVKLSCLSCDYLKSIGGEFLTVLFLNNTNVSDQGMQVLAQNCPNITDIRLQGCLKITDKGINSIAKNGQLSVVHIGGGSNITDVGVESLCTNCPDLAELAFLELDDLTDDGFAFIGDNCPSITTLGVDACMNISFECLVYVLENSNLESLFIDGCDQLDIFDIQDEFRDDTGLNIVSGYYDSDKRSWVAVVPDDMNFNESSFGDYSESDYA